MVKLNVCRKSKKDLFFEFYYSKSVFILTLFCVVFFTKILVNETLICENVIDVIHHLRVA